ncbi:hypothetical protein BDV38DRAFT_235487 [Aspergillus pseudotamarii]|uniref:Uncharacterized protein n=1 Tax=Aspergillus pseudotamarii TaxID=132259 RepID=A0A5N6T936_ASPPS|nr:uncharacterized protein BDV38DRAFT_235487 [Aspergillus pseudotamarii]KAE8142681.1 hypothetical protein BDV38DRAFT_235487 [Aspergillus pseudotamarii]
MVHVVLYIGVTCQYTVRYWSFLPCSGFPSTFQVPTHTRWANNPPERLSTDDDDWKKSTPFGRVSTHLPNLKLELSLQVSFSYPHDGMNRDPIECD